MIVFLLLTLVIRHRQPLQIRVVEREVQEHREKEEAEEVEKQRQLEEDAKQKMEVELPSEETVAAVPAEGVIQSASLPTQPATAPAAPVTSS